MIIHLNGHIGVGKYTVAKLLAKKLGARLIDNHAIINAATACTDWGSPEYRRVIFEVTDIVYRELEKRPEGEVMVFSNALVEKLWDEPRFEGVRNIAKVRNDVFVPVLLSCSLEENIRRVQSPDRKLKHKLMDANVVKEVRQEHTMIHPYDEPMALEIDTTSLTPQQTTEKIYQHVMAAGQ